MLTNGLNRFTALRQFEVWTCDANKGASCATDAGYSKRYTSPADAFPAHVAAARLAAPAPAPVRHPEHEGDARPLRRALNAVHGRALVPG